mgnify:CR=1 FL=1|tara:strand:+ start:93831 stop:93986 length:156 start_codon:yes stop_codon:yes gene_type:complete
MRNTVALLALISLLTACGQMGPLYLPEEDASDTSAGQERRAEPAPQASQDN